MSDKARRGPNWIDLRDHGWGDGMSLLDEAMAEVRAGNVVLWQEMGGGVVLTESLMTNAKANPSSPAMNRLRGELAALREALELEAEEREARDWRSNVERWET